jgi:Secretion system C-terminal sorting domain
MKNFIKLGLVFTIFWFNVSLAGTPVASIVLSNPAVSNKMTQFTENNAAAEAYTIQTTKDGVQCREIPSSKYAYFRVDDATVPSTETKLLFYITFYDEGTNTFNLQYNSNDSSGTNSNYNYKSSVITKTGSNTWITVTIALPNASFRNAQNNASDFRISGGTNVFISKIEIAKGGLNPDTEPIPVVAGSSYSEFIGKSVAGYQAWFKTGNATTGWTHWSGSTPPATNKTNFEIYPDVTEYLDTDLAQTALANLGNGTASKLFNSTNKPVIDTHFKWMKDYGIDGAAVQRFIGNIGGAIINSPNSAATKIKQAAEANGRIFYICYDTSSSGMEATWDETIKFDWVYNVEQNNNLTASPAYAKVGNKPVVQLWGTGMAGGKNPGTAAETIALIQFLQSRGCYVICGSPRGWRTGNRDSKGLAQTSTLPGDQENFEPVYNAYDMISPWMVGRIRTNADSDAMVSTMSADKTYCDARNIKYMPVIFPGFAWSQWNNGDVNWAPRNAGDFMWRQAYNIKNVGVSNMYFAMFDEYDEGTAIMKNATDWTMIPTDQYFLTSSADGTWCSSDFQLRVAGASVEMLKGTRATTTTVPIPHSLGPVYYRNSFEKRTTAYNYVNDVATKTGTFNLDPCFYKDAVLTNSNVVNPYCDIQQLNVKSGLYSVRASGTISSSSAAMYSKRISEVKIPVTKDMKLSFWKKTENNLGRFVFVDLITNTGKKLSAYSYTDQNGNPMNAATAHGTVGAGWEQFTCDFGKDILLGETIVGIQINYEQTAIGSFEAYFDDFLIEEAKTLGETTVKKLVENPFKINQNPSMGEFIVENTTGQECIFAVYNLTGQMLFNKKSNDSNERIDLTRNPDGIYLLQVIYNGNSYIQKLIKN